MTRPILFTISCLTIGWFVGPVARDVARDIQTSTFDLQHEIDKARVSGEPVVIPGGLRGGKPIAYHFNKPLNLRGLRDGRIVTRGPVTLVFHVDQPLQPLMDLTDSEAISIIGPLKIVLDGKAACAILRARSNPTAQSRWNVLDRVHVQGGAYGVAASVVIGAEHATDRNCFFMNRGMPALHLASTNRGLDGKPMVVSPFGDVAGSVSAMPSVSQTRYMASNCGFTAVNAPAAVRVGRGVTGFYFDGLCNMSAWGCRAAVQINEYGGTVVTQGEIKGGIDGRPKYSVLLHRLTHDVEFRLHTDIPWAQTHETHADEFTRNSLNAMTEYAGVVDE